MQKNILIRQKLCFSQKNRLVHLTNRESLDMPRIDYADETKISSEALALIESAEETGAPDPRCVRIYVKNEDAGVEWVKYWNSLLYGGVLPHALKELCRIYISIDHECGYCSTVRSSKGASEGVTEEKVAALMHFEASDLFSYKEKVALSYAKKFKSSVTEIDSDDVYIALKKTFSDEEIIELGMLCAQTDGVGKFAKSLNIVSWEDACMINPNIIKKEYAKS